MSDALDKAKGAAADAGVIVRDAEDVGGLDERGDLLPVDKCAVNRLLAFAQAQSDIAQAEALERIADWCDRLAPHVLIDALDRLAR